MAILYASESGAGAKNGTSEATAWDIAGISWGTLAGDTLYLMDTITSPVVTGAAGGSGTEITVRGDLPDREATITVTGAGITISHDYVIVRNLTIDTCTTYGVVLNTGADNNEVTELSINNCGGEAIRILSGLSNDIYNNIGTGNKIGISLDGSATHTSTRIINNTFINCLQYGFYVGTAIADTAASIVNNIWTKDMTSAVYTDTGWYQEATGTEQTNESNNIVYGFDTSTSGHTLDTSNITTDPQLSADYFPAPNGPCIGTGTTLLSTYDFHSRPKVGSGNHIGAKWPKLGGSSVRRKL